MQAWKEMAYHRLLQCFQKYIEVVSLSCTVRDATLGPGGWKPELAKRRTTDGLPRTTLASYCRAVTVAVLSDRLRPVLHRVVEMLLGPLEGRKRRVGTGSRLLQAHALSMEEVCPRNLLGMRPFLVSVLLLEL